MKIPLKNWTVAGSWPYTVLHGASVETGEEPSAVTPRIPARVPGSVYDDLERAGLIPDPYYERNSLLSEWVANRFWTYRTSFERPASGGRRVRLVLSGIDYHAHVFLNGRKIAEHAGMYVPVTSDVTELLRDGENSLAVVLESAPDEMGQIGYTSRTWTQKARFGYKWDFGTRLVDIGLYGEVFLDVSDDPVKDVRIRYLGDGELLVAAGNPRFRATLEKDGKTVAEGETETGELALSVPDPALWYPNGYGEQPLYGLTLETGDDRKTFPVGLRTLEYRKPVCADPDVLPYIPVVNGVPVYIKGMNMTPLDHRTGTVTREKYDRLLSLARKAGVNLIRVWGGGIIESEDFYDLCDRYGVMVWQEFIQSSSGIDNTPSKRPEFLRLIANTARAVLPVKRNHVSLTYLSGGHELMDADKVPSTFEDENLAMLKSIADELAPGVLMLPTSASGPSEWFVPGHPEKNQDVHGPWKYLGVKEQYERYNQTDMLLHSEFGVDGMSNISSIRSVLSPENRKVTTVKENLAWRHHGEWWDTYANRERPLFGEIESLEELCDLSQYLQAEGIRYAVEAHRRRADTALPAILAPGEAFAPKKQLSVGAIVWQMNEPWPNVSCTSLVDYYGDPKLAMYFWRDAEEPLRLTLRYEKLVWEAGETFEGFAFLSDERRTGADRLSVKAFRGGFSLIPGAANEKYLIPAEFAGNRVRFSVPEGENSFFVVCETGLGEETCRSVYLFLIGKEGSLPREPILRYVKEYRALHGGELS
ncbi:MAG: hypothetical protein J5849_06240 [Clostridia bacterium]|nr:hypothetical protein [Clostridia bacterium]